MVCGAFHSKAVFVCASALILGCSSDSTSKDSSPDAACAGAACGGAGGGRGSGGAGNTGAGGEDRLEAGAPCKTLTLATGQTAPDGTLALWAPAGVSLSPRVPAIHDGYLYYSDRSELRRVPTGGGAPETVRRVASNLNALFVRGTDLVWVEEGSSGTAPARILKAPIASDSGAPMELGQIAPTSAYIIADATSVYWEDRQTHTIQRAMMDGSGIRTVLTNAEIEGDVVVGTDFYWLDFNSSQLMRVPVTGGTSTPLVSVHFGGLMAADGSTVVWADHSSNTIEKWSPGDQRSTVLKSFGSSGSDSPTSGAGIAADSGFVYWLGGLGCIGVYRMRNDGTGAKLLGQGFDSAYDFALDAQHVYVVAYSGIFRVAR